MKKPNIQPLNVALFTEPTGKKTMWVAQCMDFDLVAQGTTEDKAKESFVRTLRTHLYLSEKYKRSPFTRSEKHQSVKGKEPSARLAKPRLQISYLTMERKEVVNAW